MGEVLAPHFVHIPVPVRLGPIVEIPTLARNTTATVVLPGGVVAQAKARPMWMPLIRCP